MLRYFMYGLFVVLGAIFAGGFAALYADASDSVRNGINFIIFALFSSAVIGFVLYAFEVV